MSVYSGFATRQIEDVYSKLLFKTVEILSFHALEGAMQGLGEPKRWKQLLKLYKTIRKLD